MSTVTITQFRTDFPAFTNTTLFPDGSIQFWLNFADLSLDTSRWGTWLTMGIELFVAHNVAIDADAAMDAARGLPPGFSKGILNSESVDKASAGYDGSAVFDANAGFYNLTIYGQRFYRYVRMIGAGPIHISGGWPGVSVAAESYAQPYWGVGIGPFFP